MVTAARCRPRSHLSAAPRHCVCCPQFLRNPNLKKTKKQKKKVKTLRAYLLEEHCWSIFDICMGTKLC